MKMRIGDNSTSAMSERGAVLLLTVFALAILSVLVAALLEITTTDLEIIRNHLCSTKALYIADAGIANALYELRQDYNWSAGWPGGVTFPEGSSGSYTVTVTNNYPSVTIVSAGKWGGFERKAEVEVAVSGPPQSPPYPVRVIYWKEKLN